MLYEYEEYGWIEQKHRTILLIRLLMNNEERWSIWIRDEVGILHIICSTSLLIRNIQYLDLAFIGAFIAYIVHEHGFISYPKLYINV